MNLNWCVAVLWVALVAPGVVDGAQDNRAGARPNIVLILADDLGYSDLGCYGGEIPTPNLDRLAGEGVRFTQFYNCAVCVTTRASLLTGRYPRMGPQGLLRRNMVTLAEVLRAAGYRTSLSGKWHMGSKPQSLPTAWGFDEYYGLADGACHYFDPARPEPDFFMQRKVRPFFHNTTPITKFPHGYYTTNAFADHAIDMIERFAKAESPKPFFVHLCFTAPHVPLHAPEEDIARQHGLYDEGYFRLREARFERQKRLGIVDRAWKLPPDDPKLSPEAYDWGVEPWETTDRRRQARRMEVYAAMVEIMDRNVGRVLRALDEAGAADNTVVLFLSDNGGCASLPVDLEDWRAYNGDRLPGANETYDFCGPGWGWAQSAPFRRYKTWLYEGGVSTPFIVRWPGVVKPNSLTREVGHVMDLMPTFVELAGTEYPSTFDGRTIEPVEGKSLGPLLRDGRRDGHEVLYWYLYGNRAVREGKWKLDWGVSRKRWELYDLEADRTETNDLAAEQPERVTRMAALWREWAERAEVPEGLR
jgi:arylsulfatase A-like enzyme